MQESQSATTSNSAANTRTQMRADLTQAIKARDTDRVGALRLALAAIENAEAIQVDGGSHAATAGSRHVAAASSIGETDVERRRLTADDVVAVLTSEIGDLTTQAEHHAEIGRDDVATRLAEQAKMLSQYLPETR